MKRGVTAGRCYAAPRLQPVFDCTAGDRFAVWVRSSSRNACVRSSLCPYRPLIFCSTYYSNFRRTARGMFGDEKMRLITKAVGPAVLSELSNAQAVLRDSPRMAPCLAAELYPAAINASRISASFEACLVFARRFFPVCRIEVPSGDSPRSGAHLRHPSRRRLVVICQSFVRACTSAFRSGQCWR